MYQHNPIVMVNLLTLFKVISIITVVVESSMPCVFCQIASENPADTTEKSQTVFLATDKVLGFFDIQPLVSSAAHILIIPRQHYETLDQVDSATASELGITLAKVTKLLKQLMPVEAFNVIQNNGLRAGQVVNHVHFHIVIRGSTSASSALASSSPLVSDPTASIEKSMLEKISSVLNARERMSYTALVYSRGRREDLDEEIAQPLLGKLREKL